MFLYVGGRGSIYNKMRLLSSLSVGGCDKIRPLWRHYFQNTQAIIFVVDSNDTDRLNNPDREWTASAAQSLQQTLGEDELAGVPVLIFANKQDLPSALSPGILLSVHVHVGHCCDVFVDGTVLVFSGSGGAVGSEFFAED